MDSSVDDYRSTRGVLVNMIELQDRIIADANKRIAEIKSVMNELDREFFETKTEKPKNIG